jgi:hypothetical protein
MRSSTIQKFNRECLKRPAHSHINFCLKTNLYLGDSHHNLETPEM